MKFRYDGPFDEVEVPELGATVKRGHQIEATGSVAESLAAQADWTKVAPPKKKPAAKKAAASKSTSNPDAGTPADQNEE
jgi:hypothetical protein